MVYFKELDYTEIVSRIDKICGIYGIKKADSQTQTLVAQYMKQNMANLSFEKLKEALDLWSESEKAFKPTHFNATFARQVLGALKRVENSTSNNHLEAVEKREKTYTSGQIDEIQGESYNRTVFEWNQVFKRRNQDIFLIEVQFACLFDWLVEKEILDPFAYTDEMIKKEGEILNKQLFSQEKKGNYLSFMKNLGNGESRLTQAATVCLHIRHLK